jgi:hypothetical protein
MTLALFFHGFALHKWGERLAGKSCPLVDLSGMYTQDVPEMTWFYSVDVAPSCVLNEVLHRYSDRCLLPLNKLLLREYYVCFMQDVWIIVDDQYSTS